MIAPRLASPSSTTMTALRHRARASLVALHPAATFPRYSSSSSSSKPPPTPPQAPSSSSSSSSSSPPNRFTRPGPPQLPRAEQAEFNRLVQQRSNSLQFNRAPAEEDSGADGEQLHPNARRQPQPDFEGEENPKTGEVGGPKKDPLIWHGEYTFNGRATDF